MKIKKILTIVAVAGLFIAAGVTAYVYNKAFTPNTTFNQKEVFVYIPTNATYEMVQQELAPFIKDMSKFDFVASKRNYDVNVKAGKFLLTQNICPLCLLTLKDTIARNFFNSRDQLLFLLLILLVLLLLLMLLLFLQQFLLLLRKFRG